jgi:hypothetical protein
LYRILSAYLIAFLLPLNGIFPQDKTLNDLLKENFKKKYLSIGFVFRGQFDYQPERTISGQNGFRVSHLRLKLQGELDGGYGYAFQTDFTRSQPLLDAAGYIKISEGLKIDLGQFKSPLSTEQLISTTATDFINRSQAVLKLSFGRQIGLQVSGTKKLPDNNSSMFYAFGVFNGNGINTASNDDGKFMYVGRGGYTNKFSNSVSLTAAINAGFTRDNLESFTGDRFAAGGDFRLTVHRFLISSEYLFQRLESGSSVIANNQGYHITAGYNISGLVLLLVRWDSYIPDETVGEESSYIILGGNIKPQEFVIIRINYLINTDDSELKHNQLLINAQLAF